MRKIIFLFFFMALPFVAQSASTNEVLVGNSVLDQSLDPFMYDFGKVKEGLLLKHIFVLKNSSNKALKIKEVHTSCGCTASKVGKKDLAPGESSNIEVEFKSKGYSGDIKQFIYVSTDNPDNPLLRFIIKAKVSKF